MYTPEIVHSLPPKNRQSEIRKRESPRGVCCKISGGVGFLSFPDSTAKETRLPHLPATFDPTSAPCLAKAKAMEKPKPLSPPVTKANFPDKFLG